ncbi:hypothetical protein GWI33_005346 [Rhynchophorus ferrugineus]|uniref:Uncharacterized protein n=1 Tax=Rhynchophorus ferrugineus TaxID=354439 RepID=A0A834IWR6_RHYFE|nr:hypothetical protein GWI33_005346 [Rhynchophorus ferrugineus]
MLEPRRLKSKRTPVVNKDEGSPSTNGMETAWTIQRNFTTCSAENRHRAERFIPSRISTTGGRSGEVVRHDATGKSTRASLCDKLFSTLFFARLHLPRRRRRFVFVSIWSICFFF